jgi:ubiquinone/menaquinone biosynthesis C-methylase UbiE
VEKKERVQDFFGRHAAAYSISPGHRSGEDLALLIRLMAPTGTESLLDVATATGNTALAIAPLVAQVTGLDLTPQMEAEFQAQAQARGVANACFVLGDVERMPFPADSFDLATCRRAAHHFPDIPRALAEVARVLRTGGRLGVVDMTVPEDPEAGQLFNRLELARDSSHSRALSPAQWQDAVENVGLQVLHLEVLAEDIPWNTWLFPVAVDGPEASLARELAHNSPPAASARVVRTEADGSLTFLKRRIVLVALKP